MTTGAEPERAELVAVIVCDGREVPIYARRTIDAAARRAVDDGRRLLSASMVVSLPAPKENATPV